MEDLDHHSSLTGSGSGKAVICLEGTRQGKRQGDTFSPRAGARTHLGLCDRPRLPSVLSSLDKQWQKSRAPRDPAAFSAGAWGLIKPGCPPAMRPFPTPGGRQQGHSSGLRLWQRALGAASGPTGTPRKRSRSRRDGVAERTTDTRRVSLYLSERCLINHHPLQHLLRLPETKKKVPCWTLPIGLVCPLVPDSGPASLGLPTSRSRQTQRRPGAPRHGSYPALVRQTPPSVTGQGTSLRCTGR